MRALNITIKHHNTISKIVDMNINTDMFGLAPGLVQSSNLINSIVIIDMNIETY